MTTAIEVTPELVAAMAEPVDVTGAVCDCGEPKNPRSDGCDRCSFLDGVTFDGRARIKRGAFAAQVIAALRVTERMTLRELGVEIYGSYTRGAQRTMLRVVQQLERAGRVRRRWIERTTAEDRPVFARAGGRQGFGAWAYELIGGGS